MALCAWVSVSSARLPVCRFGKRLLDSVPAEERLMRGVPKNVSKVIIHHPTQVRQQAAATFADM
jgi:hypothetical protein